MSTVFICPTCEEAPRTLRGDIRVSVVQVIADENKRLRDVLTEIATRCAETEIGFIAERALMTEEQRAAVDAVRGNANKRGQ